MLINWFRLLSDLLLNVSPSFSRYNKVFCPLPPRSCQFCPGGRIEFCRGQKWILPGGQNRILPGGQKRKQGGQKFFSRPSGASLAPLIFFLPPLKCISAPAKINPAHATVFLWWLLSLYSTCLLCFLNIEQHFKQKDSLIFRTLQLSL